MFEPVRRSRAEGFGQEVKRGASFLGDVCLEQRGITMRITGRAQKVRTLIRPTLQRAYERCDCSSSRWRATPAYRIGERCEGSHSPHVSGRHVHGAPSLAGICGLSVPCGRTAAGLPVGLQILGPAFGESVVLRAGQAVEQEMRA